MYLSFDGFGRLLPSGGDCAMISGLGGGGRCSVGIGPWYGEDGGPARGFVVILIHERRTGDSGRIGIAFEGARSAVKDGEDVSAGLKC
jgi:hypothetical protein